jgi:Spy/CpxP family protein refolding chaperone
MKGRLLQIVSITFLATLLGAAWAGPPGDDDVRAHGMHGGHHGMMRGGPDFGQMVERMSRHLELDDIQRQKLRNIVEAARPEAEALREQAKAIHEAMRALDMSNANYQAELQNLAVRNGELATQMTLLHGRIMAQVHAELTDEQKAKMSELRDHMSEGGDMMHKRFRHHDHSAGSEEDTTS